MNIIKSDVIEAKYDVFWEIPALMQNDSTIKPVLIVVADCPANSPEDQQLLKMLDACKLTTERYNIIRLSDQQQMAWHQLRDKYNPKIVFLIGILPAQLGISALFRLNEQNSFSDRIWLPTLSLSELDKSQDVKKQLWINGMKPLFIDNAALM